MIYVLLDHLNWWFRILAWHIQRREGSNNYLILLGILLTFAARLVLPDLNWWFVLLVTYLVTAVVDALADVSNLFWNLLPISCGVCLTMLGIAIFTTL